MWQAVVNAAMNQKYTIGLLEQFGLLLLQHVAAVCGHHQKAVQSLQMEMQRLYI
jgi:HD-like signal output (HDOD) protein